MLVDLRLNPEDAYLVKRNLDGTTIVTIPFDALMRAFNAYQANRAHFESAAQQETRQ